MRVARLVDAGRYAEVWEGASPQLKATITKPAFIDMLAKARQGTGTVTKRAQIALSQRETETGPDAPDGSYVIVRYATAFANDHAAHERVSLRLDDDETWRVVNYVIEPSEPSFARNLEATGDAVLVNRR